ncbi:MAG: triose-phosphate isomerase [Planctomycetales bacterium]|nr:triose-phosphate isomerase [Planctomycetales bacterium]
MGRYLIAGNWKMNLNQSDSRALAAAIAAQAGDVEADLLVCPPHVYLNQVAAEIAGTPVALGAQNAYHEPSGAFTGETSVAMLADVGCQFAILGHSERRHVMGETDADVNKKLHAVLAGGLTPIVCVGELLAERESGQTDAVIAKQFEGSLAGLTAEDATKIVLAYEPVWAIGTGKVATPDQAEQVHAGLRKLLSDRYNAEIAKSIRLLYGGSVKPDNAAELMSQPNVDGVLVGGASLKAADFLAIAAGASKAS